MARPCILVVDDDQESRDTLVELLEVYGFPAIGAANGLEAMELLLTRERMCVIFLDLVMPVMDGNAFREEQMKHASLREIPVVLISAYGDLRNHSKAMQVDAYMQKPIDAALIIDIVKRYCGGMQASA